MQVTMLGNDYMGWEPKTNFGKGLFSVLGIVRDTLSPGQAYVPPPQQEEKKPDNTGLYITAGVAAVALVAILSLSKR